MVYEMGWVMFIPTASRRSGRFLKLKAADSTINVGRRRAPVAIFLPAIRLASFVFSTRTLGDVSLIATYHDPRHPTPEDPSSSRTRERRMAHFAKVRDLSRY